MLIFYGVGTILGLGIYVLLGKIAGEAGMMAPFSFLLAASIAAFTGISYGELSARIPKSAGEVNYVDEAFQQCPLSILMGWLIILSAIVSTATVVNGYVGYVQVFAPIPDYLIITGIVVLLSAVAVWGIWESAIMIVVITTLEIIGILLVIIVAGDNLGQLPARWTEIVPAMRWDDWKMITLGAFLAFFTFIGFQDLVNVAEEARNPRKDMPRAIIWSLAILTFLYLIVATIAALGLKPQELNQSKAPLADVLAKEGENYPEIISGISLIAIVNGVLVQIVMIARVLYGMAEKRMAPKLFGRVNRVTQTPVWSTVLSAGVILILALLFDLENLAEATNYILIVVFIAINAALWRIKQKDPNPDGIRTYPQAVPVIGDVLSLAVLVFQVVNAIG